MTGQDSRETVFASVHSVLEMLKELCARPRSDEPLPLVCLRRERGPNGFPAALLERLDTALPQVPHAFIDVREVSRKIHARRTADGAEPIRDMPLLPILDELTVHLWADRFGVGRLTRFYRYRLADWLTSHSLGSWDEKDGNAKIVDLLRTWVGRRGRLAVDTQSATDQVPTWPIRLALWFLVWIGRYVGLGWARRRVPRIGRESRWFMRKQNFMIPRLSSSFLGFAERLTADRRDMENKEDIKRLLVHAFLEDLRIPYRRYRLRVLPRRSGWRRTAYVVVLLDNVTAEDGGWELLKLINEVRIETGELDPLLIVAASDEDPPPTGPEAVSAAEAASGLETWRQSLPGRRQMQAEDAWYLPIKIPGFVHSPDAPAAEPIKPRRPPVLAWRRLAETIIALLAILGSLPLIGNARERWTTHCSPLRPWHTHDVFVRPEKLHTDGVQCVGYSDSKRLVFGSTTRLKRAQLAVFGQNREAERLHKEDPKRPLIGLVYFGPLTHHGKDSYVDQSVASEIEGLYLSQLAINQKSKSDLLLHVIIANGGSGMQAAQDVAQKMLAPLFDSDPTIMAAVGLELSVDQTAKAIEVFAKHGVPVIGTILAGRGLDRRSPLYFTLVPDTAGQAALITNYALYAHKKPARNVFVYHKPTGKGDIWVDTLVWELKEKLRASGIGETPIQWREADELSPICQNNPADLSDDIAVYVGRETDIGDFIQTISGTCDRARLPRIVAPDPVFITEELGDPKNPNPYLRGVPISFLSYGSPVVLAGPKCASEGAPAQAVTGNQVALEAFCLLYKHFNTPRLQQLPPDERSGTSWPGERAGLAYDAATLIGDAVRAIPQRSGPFNVPDRAAVAQQLREPRSSMFDGTTGKIDFTTSRIGGRTLAILNIPDINQRDAVPTCEYLSQKVTDQTQTSDNNECPTH